MSEDDGFLNKRIREQSVSVPLVELPPFPRNLMLELSNGCNHACTFCFNPKMERPTRVMSEDRARAVLEEAFGLGAREVGFATTGEALIHKGIFDLVAHAKSVGYDYTYFSTNAGLFDDEKVERAFTSGLDSLKVSLNAGTRESYAKVHGRDEFDHVIRTIKQLAARRRALGRGPKLLVTSVRTAVSRGEDQALRDLIEADVDDLQFFDETQAVGPTNGTHAPLPCHMVFNRAHVSAEGLLTACCVDYENNLIVGDLARQSLEEAWESETFRALRRMHLAGDVTGTLCHVCVTREEHPYEPLGGANLVRIGRGPR